MTGNLSRRLSVALLCCILLSCCSCSGDKSAEAPRQSGPIHYTPGETTVLVPQADGTVTAGSDPLVLDFSHSDQGYFIGTLTRPDTKVNIQLTGPDGVTYKYFLESPEESAVFPFTAGSGDYLVLAFENIQDDQYASLFSYSANVTLENEFLPYLYPNQYVDFSADSEAVALAAELSKDAGEDLDALEAIYAYVTEHITYDDAKAASVQSGYLPDIDETLTSGKGICFDYAALTAAMLRALSIPARLEIGYTGSVRHAWVDVYIDSIGWIENAIEFNGSEWKLLDPTFAAAGDGSEAINDYIGDGDNYTLLYIR